MSGETITESTNQNESGSADQLIEAIVARSAQRASLPAMPMLGSKPRWQSPQALLGLVALLATLTLWNIMRYRSAPEGFTPDQANAYVQILETATAIEAFVDSAGRLPASLSQLPVDQNGRSYVVNGDTYTLSMVVDGKSVTHRRGAPLFPLSAGYASLGMNAPR